MAQIKSVTFKPSADSPMRQGFTHSTHAAVHALIADTQPGDYIEVAFDDGSVQQYQLSDASLVSVTADRHQQAARGKRPSQWLKVDVKPGVA